MSGTYGNIEFRNDIVIKKLPIFINKNIIGSNVVDAMFCKKLADKCFIPRQHIDVNDVTINEKKNTLEISMKAAESSLFDWIFENSYAERIKNINKLFVDLLKGLYDLHVSNVVHGDLKPNNVVVIQNNDFRIIDFGSVRPFYAPNKIYCTYPFCPPEAFSDYVTPLPIHDAYSLGALMLFYIYKKYLYDVKTYKTPKQILWLFENDLIEIPTQCPPLIDPELYNDIISLLHPSLYYRMPIHVLYAKYVSSKEIYYPVTIKNKASDIVLPGLYINMIALNCEGPIFDKAIALFTKFYAKYTGSITANHIAAIVVIANIITHPDVESVMNKNTRKAVVKILKVLNLDIL